jgi:hypothetical protein
VDLVRFPLLFFTSATWVVAWEAGIFPIVCRVRCGAATLDGPLRDVAGTSLSLPTVESETYSSTGEVALPAHLLRCGLCSYAGLHRAAVPGTSRCLHNVAGKDIQHYVKAKTYTQRTSDRRKDRGRRLTGSAGLYIPSALGHYLLRIRPPKMFFA